MKAIDLPLSLLALAAVVGNVAGVLFLWRVPHAYRIGSLTQWHAESFAQPGAALGSAVSFVIGLGALGALAMALPWSGERAPRGLLLAGASLTAIGALLNATGSLAPAAARLFAPADPSGAAVARGLLAVSVYADAAFNLALGIGLVLLNVAMLREGEAPAWFAVLGIVAGLASVPVAGQAVSDTLARGIVISGPLWLCWLVVLAVRGGRP